jgi:hypothetical protein
VTGVQTCALPIFGVKFPCSFQPIGDLFSWPTSLS